MVVHDFHFGWAGAFLRPLEANPPLVVDTDAPLPLAPTFERLQTIARPRQIAQAGGGIELVEFARGGSGEARKGRHPATLVERLGFPIREANDHDIFRSRCNRTAYTVAATSALRQA